MSNARGPSRLALVLALLFALTFPSVMTWLYFQALASGEGKINSLQQLAYVAGKIIQFAFPIVFVWLTSRQFPWAGLFATGREGRKLTTGLGLGLAFGLLVVGVMTGLYFGFLRDSPLLASTPLRLRKKLEEFGVASPTAYLALGVFVAAIHSLLEEYYWRWFVFGRLREVIGVGSAIVVSSLGFMAHHVIVLHAYLPGQFWNGVMPFSLSVATGGAFWAWLYQRTGTLLGSWLSHVVVDAGLFLIGWDLLRRLAG
jgi:membrane protease YdiL (CAAX protease family)